MATTMRPAPEWQTGLPPLDRFLRWAWSSPGRQPNAFLIVGGVSGSIAALTMPRGPVTVWQALLLILIALITGVVAGLTSGSRWAMVAAPPLHLAAFELLRIPQSGLTVDGLNLSIGFGMTEFMSGRGFHAFLILLPMALGVSWGASYIRGQVAAAAPVHRVRRILRRGLSGLSSALIVGLVVWLAVPPTVPAVTDAEGHAVPGSIAELRRIEIGGVDQWIEIRAASADLPVLLYLSPVPGLGNMPASRELLDPLTASFVVVTWDMRGSGKSYASFDPDTLTVEQIVSDTIEMTNYLRDQFDEERIYLVAEWWSTLISVLAAQQQPELYHAIINSDQVVAPAEADQMMYRNLLKWATSWSTFADAEDRETIEGYGPPPYDDIRTYFEVTLFYSSSVTSQSMLGGPTDPPGVYWYPGEEWIGWESVGLSGPEYSLIDRINALRSRSDVFAILHPQFLEIDLREDVPSLDVPLYMLDEQQSYSELFKRGRGLEGTLSLSLEWFDALESPDKHWGEQIPLSPARLRNLMVDIVLPATYPGE